MNNSYLGNGFHFGLCFDSHDRLSLRKIGCKDHLPDCSKN